MKIEKMHNYAEMARQFVLDLPTTFNFGRDVVDRQAELNDKPALIWCNEAGEERRFNFSDIRRRTNQLANLLVQACARVIILMPRLSEWQISMVACLKVEPSRFPASKY